MMLSEQFVTRLNATARNIILSLAPRLDQIPPDFQRFDEPFLPYGKAVIASTKDIVSGYMFNFPAYLTAGASGIIALERTLAYASTANRLTILDGEFASVDYAKAFTHGELAVTAVTISDPAFRSDFESAGLVAIVNGKHPHDNLLAFVAASLYAGKEIWPVVSVDDAVRGQMDFSVALREFIIRNAE